MQTTRLGLPAFVVLVLSALQPFAARAADSVQPVGVAAVDITPDYPIRLSGFGFRRTESEGVTQHIWAKAIAFGGDESPGPAVIVTVDSTGVPDHIRRDVAERLTKRAKIDPSRFAITSSHTHTAPMVSGVLATLFGRPVTPDEQKHIDRYTRELTDNIEKAALAALADRKPATLEFGIGTGDLAMNRRTKGGPVDNDLPVLVVRAPDGKVRAVYINYACHCVTLSHNKIGGDWAGFVQETLQKTYPGAIALTSIGCGADSNPKSGVTGDKVDVAAEQGRRLAAEVERVIKQGNLAPVAGPLTAKSSQIELMFDTPPTKEELQKRVDAKQEYVSYHAQAQLDRLNRGEQLQTRLPYLVQTWTFGDDLAMVFLPGEVVVDYSLRLKRDFDRSRLWLNAYSNDVPCYIPSERVLKEGGYEGGGAMTFYDRPTKLAAGLEQKIVAEVHRQLPKEFAVPPGTEGVAPKSPEASRRTIRTKPGLEVELVASEPLVTSPVAIDWGADGRLWVCEMYDYPTGADNNWAPGGRVKFLTDKDGDGRYDTATVFLDKLPFPTGVTAWGRGVLVCAAPDILYAEDTDNDGEADKVEKLFTGFDTDNYQARVNSLTLGLDNWIYVANGLRGGTITSPDGKTNLDIRGRDFRFKPLGSRLETVTGLTQQGRVRDDWGNWFGCDNSTSLWYYPHEARYLSRNPSAPAPPPAVPPPPSGYDPGRVFPISRTLERFNHPDGANHITSACGLGIYRDTLLGEAYYGNAFVCEPVHNLVHRMILSGDEPNLTRTRAAGERDSEFLASSDNWFRPVQVRTGPDGALYVVDMYRFLIEHPRWIPAERMAKIDPRAGADKGRIYRIRPAGSSAPPRVADLTKLSTAELVEALGSNSGTQRDRAHVELLVRQDHGAVPTLERLAVDAPRPQARVQALSAIEGLGGLNPGLLERALKDADAHVRKHAVRLCEGMLGGADGERVGKALLAMSDDASPVVVHQLAYTLGEWNDRRAGEALARLAARGLADGEMRTAVLSAGARHCGEILRAGLAAPANAPGRGAWIAPLVATAAASDDSKLLGETVLAVLPAEDAEPTPAHFDVLATLLGALESKGAARLTDRPELSDAMPRVERTLAAAARLAADENAAPAPRASAIRLLGYGNPDAKAVDLLCRLAATSPSGDVRSAAVAGLRRQRSADVAAKLLGNWHSASPAARAEVLNLLLARDEWATALLGAVRDERVQRSEISLADRQRLLKSDNAALRADAAKTFPPDAAGTSTRAEVLARYASVAGMKGDAAKGRELFAANCVACHRIGDLGHAVGPDLALLRDKDADYWVKNVLDPSAIVEPRFVNYQVVTQDRRSLSGVITAESATDLTLAAGNGAAETVKRSDVKEIRASAVSMMPEGLEGALSTPQQMADLIAFLKAGTAPPAKQFPGNTPETVAQAADGSLVLPATLAEIRGGDIELETQLKNVGSWHAADDQVSWMVRVDKAAAFDVHLDYACDEDSGGNEFVVTAADAKVTGVVKPTGPGWSWYRQVKVDGTLSLPAGESRVTVRPSGPVRVALLDLRTLALTPPGVKPKWPEGVRAPRTPDRVARDPASVAAIILDPRESNEARETALSTNPQFAAELIREMTKDLPAKDAKLEYERIPWLWRVALLAGKRNDANTIHHVLDAALPAAPDAPALRDWQAVAIGGGVINGISQRGLWPADRIDEILGNDDALRNRWRRALDLASAMADDEKIRPGTRYDAMRMLGMESWDKRGGQLARYLGKGVNAELQMGAVSGLADVNSPRATAALIDALSSLSDHNRELALDALLRGDERRKALAAAVKAQRVDEKLLGQSRRDSLTK
jgi:putative membrane-bound dehydrogenase-like protein